MKLFAFAGRNAKEILRDPLTSVFALGFPLALLWLLSAIQANVPVELFAVGRLAPGIAVFGLSFMTLFSATLLSKDRESAFLARLRTTPLTAADFLAGYLLPALPIALGQSALCFAAAVPLGLPVGLNLLLALVLQLPAALVFLSLGLLCGSLLSVKQVGGICGALLTNLAAWLSGIWFDLDLVGGWFRRAAELLPFFHAVELQRAAVAGQFAEIPAHLFWVLGYAAALFALAVAAFRRKLQ